MCTPVSKVQLSSAKRSYCDSCVLQYPKYSYLTQNAVTVIHAYSSIQSTAMQCTVTYVYSIVNSTAEQTEQCNVCYVYSVLQYPQYSWTVQNAVTVIYVYSSIHSKNYSCAVQCILYVYSIINGVTISVTPQMLWSLLTYAPSLPLLLLLCQRTSSPIFPLGAYNRELQSLVIIDLQYMYWRIQYNGTLSEDNNM